MPLIVGQNEDDIRRLGERSGRGPQNDRSNSASLHGISADFETGSRRHCQDTRFVSRELRTAGCAEKPTANEKPIADLASKGQPGKAGCKVAGG